MAISKAFALGIGDSAAGTTQTTGTFDSTGYTHLVVFTKYEGASDTPSVSDNKGSTGWSSLTRQGNGVSDSWGQFFWAKIGTPGTGHTVTVTTASRPYRSIVVWRIASGTGEISVVSEVTATGSSATPDAGTLSNAGGDSVVSFMGVAEYNAVVYTAGTGWAEDYDPNGPIYTYGQSRGAETTTSIDPTCTGDGTQDWAACAVAFKESSSGLSITAGLGQLTITGYAPALAASGNFSVSAGLGQLAFTGLAPSVARTENVFITAGLGQLTATGYAPSQTLTLPSPAPGLLVLTGYAPSIQVSAPGQITAGLGQLTLTGLAPTVSATDSYSVSAGLAQLTLTGLAPALAVTEHQFAAPDVGLAVLTGFAPTLAATENQFATPALGELTLDGYAPSLTQAGSFSASPDVGILELLGLAPDVSSSETTASGPFYKRFKRKYALWINGTKYLGTQEDFERLVAKTFDKTPEPELPPLSVKVDVKKSDGFEVAAKELEQQLEQALRKIHRDAYQAREDEEILEFL